MDHANLAETLVAADENERWALLSEHLQLVDAQLAWALKSRYDAVESHDPAGAAQVALTLALLPNKTGNVQVSAIAAWVQGMVSLDEGQLEAALEQLETAGAQFMSSGLPVQAAATNVSRLRALAMLGRFEDALSCGIQARDVFLAHNDILATGKIEQNLGNIHFMLDRYPKAEQHYRAARELYEMVDDQKQLAQIDNCLATTLTSQHRFREASMVYDKAYSRAEAAGLEVTLAEIEANQGSLALFRGDFDRALDYLERSRRRYAALGLPPRLAVADQELADAYLELNLTSEAAAIYKRVVPVLSSLGMQTEHARALAFHGRACLAIGHIEEARQLLAQAQASYEAAGNPVGKAMVRLIEAQIHYAEGRYLAAGEAAAGTENAFADVQAWGRLLMARWLQGEAERVRGNFHEAERLIKGVLQDAKQWAVLPLIHRCHTSLGLIAKALGDKLDAERAFEAAVFSIEEMRAPLPAEEFRIAFLADKLVPYTELVRLCLADGRASRVADALAYVERARSRALVDIMRGTLSVLSPPADEFESHLVQQLKDLREELNWYYSQINLPDSDAYSRGAEMVSSLYDAVRDRETRISEISLQLRQKKAGQATQAEPFDINLLKHDLGSETALVEYFSLDGQLLAFLMTDEVTEVVHLPASENEVEAALRQLHFQLGALRHRATSLASYLPELTGRARHHLCVLYDLLMRPIESRIGPRRLLVVPHRILHYVPFHALCDGSSYIVERREVCWAPSAAVLHRCLTRPQQPLRRGTLLGVADEHNPRARDEVLEIAPLFPEAKTLLDELATRVSLSQQASSTHVLHVASHGNFRVDNPQFSALKLADGWLTVRDVYQLGLSNCELVTLSACETGVSALLPGDEWLGLARGFFSAGAPSLLVSQWAVDDEATASLMVSFYSALLSGIRPGAALRYAQCQMLEKHPHPYYWAPFVLLGRW
ncbi:MAG TPA: CHAT domain-containing tetratricopeptide repeat protein [Anaerolineales bacterium]|nr:CHAT domain-containing tetratricopeptide repeat protein [Anaerolineales bacterium]